MTVYSVGIIMTVNKRQHCSKLDNKTSDINYLSFNQIFIGTLYEKLQNDVMQLLNLLQVDIW